MSDINQDIPGFYRDPVTGKYYADRPGVSGNPALKKLKTERCKEFNVTPKITNVVPYFNAREMRAIGGVQESREYLKMRWCLKQRIPITEVQQLSRYFTSPSVNTGYLSGSNHSMYGFWYDEKFDRSLAGIWKFKETFNYDSRFYPTHSHVIDMCEGLTDDFIVVYSPSYSHNLLAERFYDYERESMIECLKSPCCTNTKQYNWQIFCCSCNKKRVFHAFGSENRVICINSVDRKFSHKIIGRIHSISFDDTGDLMIAGVHSGNLILYDLRVNKMVMTIEVSKSCLVDLSVINSNHIIASGTDDVLCKVDIRIKEVVSEFLTHKQQDIRKSPLSIGNNMLCAAGSDNRIRIWDLSGGLPLHEIKPDNPENKIRGYMTDIDRKLYLYCFECVNEKVFQIM